MMISWYISVIDGECQVERDLALLKAILAEHQGSMDLDGATVSDLLELRIDGPASPKDIATQIYQDAAGEGGPVSVKHCGWRGMVVGSAATVSGPTGESRDANVDLARWLSTSRSKNQRSMPWLIITPMIQRQCS